MDGDSVTPDVTLSGGDEVARTVQGVASAVAAVTPGAPTGHPLIDDVHKIERAAALSVLGGIVDKFGGADDTAAMLAISMHMPTVPPGLADFFKIAILSLQVGVPISATLTIGPQTLRFAVSP